MKLLAISAFSLTAILAAAFVSPISEARSIRAYESHNLSTVMINGEKTDYAGRVTINYAEQKIHVELGKDICGHYSDAATGTIRCMAMPIPVAEFEVPLQKRENSCGSAVYSGSEDKTPVDGLRTSIVVMNHAGRMCEDYRPYGIEVRVETFNLRSNTTTHYFLGK